MFASNLETTSSLERIETKRSKVSYYSSYYIFTDGGFKSNCSSWAFVILIMITSHVYISDFGSLETPTDVQEAELQGLHKALLVAHQAGIKDFFGFN